MFVFFTNFYYKRKEDIEFALKLAGFDNWEIRKEAYDKFGCNVPEYWSLYIPKEEYYTENPKIEKYYIVMREICNQILDRCKNIGIAIPNSNTRYLYVKISKEELLKLAREDTNV